MFPVRRSTGILELKSIYAIQPSDEVHDERVKVQRERLRESWTSMRKRGAKRKVKLV